MHWLERFLLPPSCQLCGATAIDDELCAECAQTVTPIDHACPLCALPNQDGSVCTHCSQHPPLWQQAHSAFTYDGNLRQLMRRWKYGKQLASARLLGDALIAWITVTQYHSDASAIIAMPMHKRKLGKRGFNTAHQLAYRISRHFNITLLEHALERTYVTDSQAGLDKAARERNLMGSFRVNPTGLHGHSHILLIDDVYTTGSTAKACCSQLYNAGVKQIDVLTLARALPHKSE